MDIDQETQDQMNQLIVMLSVLLGRLPTEDEVYDYIFGSDDRRAEILAIDKANPTT